MQKEQQKNRKKMFLDVKEIVFSEFLMKNVLYVA